MALGGFDQRGGYVGYVGCVSYDRASEQRGGDVGYDRGFERRGRYVGEVDVAREGEDSLLGAVQRQQHDARVLPGVTRLEGL